MNKIDDKLNKEKGKYNKRSNVRLSIEKIKNEKRK